MGKGVRGWGQGKGQGGCAVFFPLLPSVGEGAGDVGLQPSPPCPRSRHPLPLSPLPFQGEGEHTCAVLLLTGYGTLETCRAALRMGAHNYLLKPCPDSELLESIEEAIQQRAKKLEFEQALKTLNTMYSQIPICDPIPEHDGIDKKSGKPNTPEKKVGELRIGTNNQYVYLNDSQIHVTPIEVAFLRFLANTPGEVCHYHTILQYTHNITSEHRDARDLLRPHAYNIRRKIGTGYLVHERGIGYRLVDPTNKDPQ